MALKFFGNPDNDPGEWIRFGSYTLRVRAAKAKKVQEFSKRYGKEVFDTSKEGVRTASMQRTIDQDRDYKLDQSAWALTDIRGLTIEIADDVAARDAKKLFGLDTVNVGEELDLEGRIGSMEARKVLVRDIRPVADIGAEADAALRDTLKTLNSEMTWATGTVYDIGSFLTLQSVALGHKASEASEKLEKNS